MGKMQKSWIAEMKLNLMQKIRAELQEHGLWTGGTVFVMHNGCYECGEESDHCQINCSRKNVFYIEPATITDIHVHIVEGQTTVEIQVKEGECIYNVSTLGKLFFVSRDDAIQALMEKQKEGA